MRTEYFTVKEVAEILHVHWQSVLNFIKRGDLEAIHIGRGYRIELDALRAFEKSRKVKTKP